MEALTRLVSDSLARYGLDRPVDPQRLQWSRWFHCHSPHSLLVVPSKPGIFAVAEEITSFPNSERAEMPASVAPQPSGLACPDHPRTKGEDEQGCPAGQSSAASLAAEAPSRRMLAILQFSEDDNMAFVLDRMFAYANPMRLRLNSGSCFVRFVVVEDQQQRRTICAALNQWMRNSAEKASGLPVDFSSSLEFASENVARPPSPAFRAAKPFAPIVPKFETRGVHSVLEAGGNGKLHCPQPFPSGF